MGNELVINPAPLVNNGLSAPYAGQIYELAAVPVPDGASIDSQLITDASGAPPTASSLPDETWMVVYKGRPDATHNFGPVPFRDPWGVVLEVKGTSNTQPSEHPIWHWTVTYELKDATSCPTGGAGPQPSEAGKASAAPTESTPTAANASPKTTVATEPDGSVEIGLTWPAAPTRINLKVGPPAGHTVSSIQGLDGLSCTNDHDYGECTSAPGNTSGVAIDSVILDLTPKITGSPKATTETTKNSTTVDITIPPPAPPVKHATLEAQIETLKGAIDLQREAIDLYDQGETKVSERTAGRAAGELNGLADGVDYDLLLHLKLGTAARADLNYVGAGTVIAELRDGLKESEAALDDFEVLAGDAH